MLKVNVAADAKLVICIRQWLCDGQTSFCLNLQRQNTNMVIKINSKIYEKILNQ